MTEPRPVLDQVLDHLVYGPLGALAALRDELPKLAAQGRREVQVAKMFGQFAVEQGRRELDKRIRPPEPTAPAAPKESRPAASSAAADPLPPTEPEPAHDPIAAETLAIAEYDSLAASQVVARLAALAAGELDAIERYETAGRARRTILGKIAQLRSSR